MIDIIKILLYCLIIFIVIEAVLAIYRTIKANGLSVVDQLIFRSYHKWYHGRGPYEKTTFLGVGCIKLASDMWNYQEIIFKLKPSLIVEFGVLAGGSTMYFSNILKLTNPNSRVFAVDIDLKKATDLIKHDPHIQTMECSSSDPKVAQEIMKLRSEYPGPAFFILDSAHSKKHVLAEMRLLRDVTRTGDYVIVEDSCINGHPILPNYGEGPWEAINEYFKLYPKDYIHDRVSENKYGLTAAPNGYLIRQ